MRLPWPNDLDTQTWPRYGQDVPSCQNWSFCVNLFKSYRHTDTVTQTDTHTHWHDKNITSTIYVEGNYKMFIFGLLYIYTKDLYFVITQNLIKFCWKALHFSLKSIVLFSTFHWKALCFLWSCAFHWNVALWPWVFKCQSQLSKCTNLNHLRLSSVPCGVYWISSS